MGKIARYLNQLTVGNVFDSNEILEAYSTDRSVLKIKPRLVALPESTEDVRRLMRFCYQLAAKGIKIPVTVRGSGLDETGADLGNGLILSTEKLNRLLESDRRERLVRVQGGITLKELNTALSVNGLTVPIGDEHEMETIGGLISNCPTDAYAGKYGGIMEYIERIEVILPNGDILQTENVSERTLKKKAGEKTLESEIYRKLTEIIDKNSGLFNDKEKSHMSMAGYPMLKKIQSRHSVNLMPIFFGAQGTLGVITEVILRAVPIAKTPKRAVATFTNYLDAEKFLDVANALKPRSLELYDINIIKTAEETGKRLSEITNKLKSGFVVYAEYDTRRNRSIKRLTKARKDLPKSAQLIVESPATAVTLDEFENSLVSFLNHAKSSERPPIVTDFYVPPRNMSSFVNDLVVLGNGLKLDLAVYGSYATTNYYLRPKFDISDEDFSRKATAFLKAGAFVVKRQGGVIAGGAPGGRVKAMVTNDEMSDEEKKIYLDIKSTFDRYDIMNPNVKLGADARYTLRHFRSEAGKVTL